MRSRRAAVLIAIFPHRRSGELSLVLTRRPMSLSHHGGQICLPGGRIEAGESPLTAALREYHEELGVGLRGVRALGRLAPMYVFASDNWVETLVVATDTPTRHWQPDSAEVDQVIEMPVGVLSRLHQETLAGASGGRESVVVRRRYAKRTVRGPAGGSDLAYRFGYPEIQFEDCGGHPWTLWGATAMLLAEFAAAWNRVA
jgi:8-oxo-dGTP pyrophosphatase MutT (NUDIX family)